MNTRAFEIWTTFRILDTHFCEPAILVGFRCVLPHESLAMRMHSDFRGRVSSSSLGPPVLLHIFGSRPGGRDGT